MLYQVYCESDNNKVISALYQTSNDINARDKIRSYVRDSVIKHQISWLITIHRSDNKINFDDLHLKSPQSIKLKENILSASTTGEFNDFIWIEDINVIDSSLQDQDIINILDYLQDNNSPEVIEIKPYCILLPDEIEGDYSNKCAKWRPGRPCIPMTRVLENFSK